VSTASPRACEDAERWRRISDIMPARGHGRQSLCLKLAS
jgi:hypothetical protein